MAGASCPILVTNIIDVHDNKAPAKKVLLKNKGTQTTPSLQALPLPVPDALLKYVNSKSLWKS